MYSNLYHSDRILYYLAHSIAPQGHKGKREQEREDGLATWESWNFNLKPVYGIFFLNFPLDNLKPQLIRTVKFMVEETNEVFNDKVRAYTIQLPCVKRMRKEDCRSKIEYWSYILYNMETMNTQLPFADQQPIFMKMEQIASYSQMNPEQQRVYMDSLNRYRTAMAVKEYDFSRGMEKGRAEGRVEGRAEGRVEERIVIAINLKSLGTPYNIISQATGLTAEEIDAL